MVRLTINLITISLMLVGISYAKIDPETCVGLWLFEEDAGKIVIDISGKDNQGKIVGAKLVDDGKV